MGRKAARGAQGLGRKQRRVQRTTFGLVHFNESQSHTVLRTLKLSPEPPVPGCPPPHLISQWWPDGKLGPSDQPSLSPIGGPRGHCQPTHHTSRKGSGPAHQPADPTRVHRWGSRCTLVAWRHEHHASVCLLNAYLSHDSSRPEGLYDGCILQI